MYVCASSTFSIITTIIIILAVVIYIVKEIIIIIIIKFSHILFALLLSGPQLTRNGNQVKLLIEESNY